MQDEPQPKLSARYELAALTKRRVMEAVAQLMREGADVTFEVAAKASGVPPRTLYRYFENREALFGAFWTWVNEYIEVPALPKTPDEVIAHVPALFAAFDRDEVLVRAMMHDPYGRAVRASNAEARRKKFAAALRPVIETLPEAEAGRLLASVTVLCSATGWESMKDNWQMSGSDAAAAAQWAIRNLIAAARAEWRESRPHGDASK